MRKVLSLSVLVAVALAAATTALAALDRASATTVTVAAGKPSELRFTLSTKTAARGVVTFRVTNRGTIPHDFKIAGRKTPILAPGKTATLRVTISKPGRYTYLCTLPGHAAGGMKGTFSIR